MKIDKVKKLSPMDRLLYFISERESIRRKRALGLEAPWTDDTILQSYRFCNVRRMDDKVSQWLMSNWYKPYKNHQNMVLAATLARQLNNPESLSAIGFPESWDPEAVEAILNSRVFKGLKNFSAAYMITGTLGGTKVHQIIRKVADPIYRNPPKIDTRSMQLSAESLLPYSGFSDFIAGQVVADLRWALTGTWEDRNTWAPIGPGSKRGLNRLNEVPANQAQRDSLVKTDLTGRIKEMRDSLPTDLTKRLEAIDYQNCLCEWDKYERTLSGEGRPKQLYRGAK